MSNSDTNPNANSGTDDGEYIDLSGLDRGDEFNPGDDDGGNDGGGGAAGRPRNPDGTFKAKDADAGGEGDEEEGEEEEEEEEEEGGEEEEEENEEEGGEKGDKQNFPVRLNKAKEQRDRERQRAEEAEAKLQAAQQRLAELERALNKDAGDGKPTKEDDPLAVLEAEADSLYEQIEDARADADTQTAARLQRELDKKNREIARIEAQRAASAVTSRAAEAARFDAMLDMLEAAVPEVNGAHEDFDKAQVMELELLVTAYEKAGLTSTAALKKASKLLLGFDFDKPEAKKGRDRAADDVGEDAGKKPRAKGTDIKKALDREKRQPPDASDRGVNKDSTKIRVWDLDDEAFSALPESKKAQLRGDFG